MTGVAAFAFGAFAFSNGSGFDSLTAGEAFTAAGDNYWGALPSDLEATVTAYAGSGETAYATRPAYFTGDNVNFLAIESASAADPLVRYINESSTTGKDIDNGLYLDTLVKFTASTETMGTSDENAKLAIWAQTSDETPEVTNFVVQAGYFGTSGLTSTNYVMTAPANFDFTAWHRLTVKAIDDIDADANKKTVGFVVFVDETALTRADPAAIGDEGYVPTLNTVAGKFATAVLPSKASPALLDAQKLTAVSFSGNGGIDDISFTDVAPAFAENDVIFTLNVGDGITGFTLNGTSYSDFTDGFVTLKLNSGVTIVTVGDVTYADGYKNAALSDASDGTVAGLVFTVTGDAPVATISAVRDMFFVGGKGYATLAAAVAAVSGEANTITLNGDYTLTEADFGEEGSSVFISTNVVIDLKGCALDSAETDSLFVLKEDASITFINTDATKDGELTCADAVVWNDGEGSVIFGQKEDTNYVVVNGAVSEIGGLSIVKGKFDVASNTEDNECAIAEDMVAEGSTLAEQAVDGYWVVDVDGEEPVTTYTVTFVDYDGTEISSGDVAEGETPTAPTAPSRTGYTFTGWTPTIAAVTEAATYTATYSANTYTVTFYTNSVEYATANYTYGDASTYTAPDAPVVDGFTFGGWFTDNGTFETAFVFSAGVAGNTQVAYAKLTANEEPPEIEPVDPAEGGTAEFSDAATATAAAVAINEDKAKYIAAPEGIANTYYDNVEAKADGTTVSVVFTTAGETAAQTSADAEVDELDKVLSAAAAGATEASITDAVPGFFYSVVYGTSLTGEGAFANEGTRAQADKDGNVTIPVPTAGEGAGFYKVKVSPTK